MDTLKTEREKERRLPPECAPLLKAAHINIYRENSFRITGIPADASEKDIKKHADKLKMLEELGYAQNAKPPAFALDPSPSVDQIRDAMQRIKDPEDRLVDEFFWFWPKGPGKGTDDPAIQAVLNGEANKAQEIWVEMEASPEHNYIAWHNLAVMYHLMALDWTVVHITSKVTEEHERVIVGYWKDSFARWEKIASDDRVWDAMKARIKTLDDPRLTTGFVRRFCSTLPEALDKINAEVALRFGEQGRTDWAKIHIDFMKSTHQGIDDVEKTAELVLAPTRKRIRQHLKAAIEDSEKSPETGTIIARRLVEQCKPLHLLFQLFHGVSSPHTTELFDDVANALNSCISDYNIKTKDYSHSTELYREALNFATAEEVRKLIESNIEISERNARKHALAPIFTRVDELLESKEKNKERLKKFNKIFMPQLMELLEKEPASSETITMVCDKFANAIEKIGIDAYNIERDYATAAAAGRIALKLIQDPEDRERIENNLKLFEKELSNIQCHYCGKNVSNPEFAHDLPMHGEVEHSWGSVSYSKKTIRVPRCFTCKNLHAQEDSVGWVAGLGAGALAYVLFGVFALFPGILVAWLASTVAQAIMQRKTGLKPYTKYPPIEELLAKGWKLGQNPGK
ncbi:MAG: hypothetical protein ACAI35_13145 [Candidatus Methylacidiphilales bacterium]|nr:hypothetical protein [Candidatus Methylacidiphilales bacterium]